MTQRAPTARADPPKEAPGPAPGSQATQQSERRERRLGVVWGYQLTDAAGLWPEQLGLDTCGECDVDDPSEEPPGV